MKYRNDLTNIGILCGFAESNSSDEIVVHQCAARELGFRLRLADSARPAEFPYEPVTVIFRILPAADGGEPTLEALHVSRLAKQLIPKTFYWNSASWPRTNDFYPFEPTRAGRLSEAVSAQIAETTAYPDWLVEAAENDDTLADLIERPTSNKHLLNRFLLTGQMTPGELVEVPRLVDAHDYLRVWLRQGEGDSPVGARMPQGTRGFHFMGEGRCGPEGAATTILGKVLRVAEGDAANLGAVSTDLLLLEAGAIAPHDLLMPTRGAAMSSGLPA